MNHLSVIVVGIFLMVMTRIVWTQEKTDSRSLGRIEQIKNPMAWFMWGADVRLRHESIQNPSLTDADPPGYNQSFERLRVREWNTVRPCPEFEFTIRFTWEGRHYWMPVSKVEWDKSEVVFDNVNGKFKFQEVPLTLIVGRQDIVFGDGWLVSDGTPLDGPRTAYFDAVCVTIDLVEIRSALDLIYIDQTSGSGHRLRPIYSKNISLMEQDERGAIVNFTSTFIGRTQIDPYFIYKHDEVVLSKGDNGDVYTIGSRLDHDFDNNASCHIEGAYQWGDRTNAVLFPNQDGSLPAGGMLIQANYNALFAYANRNSGIPGFSEHGRFKGSLFTGLLRYRLDRCWSGLILGEYFIPGNYYETPSGGGSLAARNHPAAFLRTQIIFTF